MPSPSSGAYADELLERARERRLAVKSGLNRDFEQRHGGLHHQLLRVLDAMLDQPLVSGDAE
jgi:membrane glycosyltransferase